MSESKPSAAVRIREIADASDRRIHRLELREIADSLEVKDLDTLRAENISLKSGLEGWRMRYENERRDGAEGNRQNALMLAEVRELQQENAGLKAENLKYSQMLRCSHGHVHNQEFARSAAREEPRE